MQKSSFVNTFDSTSFLNVPDRNIEHPLHCTERNTQVDLTESCASGMRLVTVRGASTRKKAKGKPVNKVTTQGFAAEHKSPASLKQLPCFDIILFRPYWSSG